MNQITGASLPGTPHLSPNVSAAPWTLDTFLFFRSLSLRVVKVEGRNIFSLYE